MPVRSLPDNSLLPPPRVSSHVSTGNSCPSAPDIVPHHTVSPALGTQYQPHQQMMVAASLCQALSLAPQVPSFPGSSPGLLEIKNSH